MTKTPSDEEVRGRLALWSNTLIRVGELLILAGRARGSVSPEKVNDPEEIRKTMEHDQPFPKVHECLEIHNSCIELAIVYFCQVLKQGKSAPQAVAENNKGFIETHFYKNVVEQVFTSPADLGKYRALCAELIDARNKMLAHAEGGAFNVTHLEYSLSHKVHSHAWRNIDLNYWKDTISPVHSQLNRYSSTNWPTKK